MHALKQAREHPAGEPFWCSAPSPVVWSAAVELVSMVARGHWLLRHALKKL